MNAKYIYYKDISQVSGFFQNEICKGELILLILHNARLMDSFFFFFFFGNIREINQPKYILRRP